MTIMSPLGVDCRKPQEVQLVVIQHGDTLRVWVNVDGVCAFRAYEVPFVALDITQVDLKLIRPISNDNNLPRD